MKSARMTHRRGLAYLELMVAMAIGAMLLIATAVATDASFRAYQANQEQSSLLQRARIAMERLTTVIRTTSLQTPDSLSAGAQFSAGMTVNDTGIDVIDDSGVTTAFRYDQPNQRILAIVGAQTNVLLDGVTLFQVTLEPERSPNSIRTGGPYDLMQRATIVLTVRTNAQTNAGSETTGSQTVTLSGSVMPRRNTW